MSGWMTSLCHVLVINFHTTGFPEVGVTPLIAHVSLMPGPITEPFDSMKLKTGRVFLVYDGSSYWLYYPVLGMTVFLTGFSRKWKVHMKKVPTQNNFFYALS